MTILPVLYSMCVCVRARVCMRTCMHSVAQSCLTLCNPLDCSPPASLVHYSLVTYLLLHMLIWWLQRPGCGPGLGCSQSCAQGLLTVQGASLCQPAARAPTDQPRGTCSPSVRLRAGVQQPRHTFQASESQARWHLHAGTLGVSVWRIPAFFLPGPNTFRPISSMSHLIFPYLRGWMQSLRSDCGLLTAAPARVVLAGGAGRDGGRHPHLEFVTVLFMVSSFNLRNYLSTGGNKRCSLFCIKRNTGYHLIFISWNGTWEWVSVSYLYHYILVVCFLDFLKSRLVFFLLFFYSFVCSFIHLLIHPLNRVRDLAPLNDNRRWRLFSERRVQCIVENSDVMAQSLQLTTWSVCIISDFCRQQVGGV